MAFFDRFFKSTPPLTLDQKIDALSAYSTQQLLEAIDGDEVAALKHAAIQRLPFGDELLALATSRPRSPFEAQARKRIGELLDEKTLTVDELSKRIADQTLLLTLCGFSTSAGIALVAKIDDEALLLALAKSSATTAIRQAAAEKIHDPDLLLALQKVAKNKDKSVSKIVKDKLDELKQVEIQNRKINDEATALCSQLEQLAKRDVGEHFAGQKLQLSTSWQSLDGSVSEPLQARFAQALALCQAKIDEREAEIQKQKHLEEVERSAKKQLLASINDLQQFIAELFSSVNTAETTSQLDEINKSHIEALQSAKDNGLNTRKEERHFNELMEHARELAHKLSENGSLASLLEKLAAAQTQAQAKAGETIKNSVQSIITHAKALQDVVLPEIIGSSQHLIDQWNRDARERAQIVKTQISESFTLIRRGFAAVGEGQIRRARAIYNDLEKRIETIGTLPAQLEVKYDEFKAAMHTLGDWHEFSVTPKKHALIESMNGLVESTLHPKDLAERIKGLQEEWKVLSKGGKQDDSALWEQFQAAGKLAYEPCKTYFAEETEERQKNTRQRQQLIVQLQQYLDGHDWDNANWKDVEKTLRVARETWQSFWPVSRKDNKELQVTFEKITDAIYQKISDEFESNRVKKQSVVDRAEQLLEATDIAEAIESAKKLQKEWQAVGRVKPRIEQELWKAFRSHCDAIFDKRKQESEAEQQAREAEKIAAEDILLKFQNILALTGPEFFAAKPQTDELIGAFKNLGELPRNCAKTLNQTFYQYIDKLQEKVVFERKQAQLSAWVDIFSANQKINRLEILAGNNEATDELIQVLNETFANAQKWPNVILSNLQTRLDTANTYALDMQEENLHKLRLLCVRAEIVNDIVTPAEDKNIRMEYQMAQLQRGLGSLGAQEDNSLEGFVSDWVAVSATAEADYQKQEDRFRASLGLA